MADEDEIDILGDFALDNLLSKNESDLYNSGLGSHNSDGLNCDCSSQWLLDHNVSSGSNYWYNSHTDFCSELAQSVEGINSSIDNQITSENIINDDTGWTVKEKNLLDEGIEIFGKSSARLAQFIGTKSANEVKYYLKNYFVASKFNNSAGVVVDGDVIEETVVTSDDIEHDIDYNKVLNDSEIPASIEEVIAVVSSAKPTIQVNPKRQRKKSNIKILDVEINYNDIPSGASVLKNSIYKETNSFYNGKEDKSKIHMSTKMVKKKRAENVKFKIRAKMKVPRKTKIKSKLELVKEANDTRPPIPNFEGEEVIKIEKEDSNESDLEIDVENIEDKNNIYDSISSLESAPPVSDKEVKVELPSTESIKESTPKHLSEFSKEIIERLKSAETPSHEIVLEQDVITDLEKCVNSEFFEGRPAKTPARYLKIRNYILNMWFTMKPTYVTKTCIRPGLKNCGDVNSIGRIHQFLEQIGAINFGCVQTTYVRPLYNMLITNTAPPKEKAKNWGALFSKPITLSRPRIKRKLVNDGEGGLTLTHDEKGNVINTTVVNEEPVIKQRSYIKKPTIRLIYCKAFTEENPQKYKVQLHLSSLLLMDLHAHTSRTEVMGLIAGHWNSIHKTLIITRYIPCQNIASSSTHCDMCPISQAKAADIIHGEGLNILGWFHSHPTFAPEPSLQDMDTQLSVQQWIGNNKPCIGLILSPFSAHGALIASPYRCLIVDKKINFEDQYVPYKFKVELISSELDVDYLLSQAWRIFNTYCNAITTDRINFNKPYLLDESISYFDKFIYSIKMHLAKCTDLNKMTCDSIIQGFSNICCQ